MWLWMEAGSDFQPRPPPTPPGSLTSCHPWMGELGFWETSPPICAKGPQAFPPPSHSPVFLEARRAPSTWHDYLEKEAGPCCLSFPMHMMSRTSAPDVCCLGPAGGAWSSQMHTHSLAYLISTWLQQNGGGEAWGTGRWGRLGAWEGAALTLIPDPRGPTRLIPVLGFFFFLPLLHLSVS